MSSTSLVERSPQPPIVSTPTSPHSYYEKPSFATSLYPRQVASDFSDSVTDTMTETFQRTYARTYARAPSSNPGREIVYIEKEVGVSFYTIATQLFVVVVGIVLWMKGT